MTHALRLVSLLSLAGPLSIAACTGEGGEPARPTAPAPVSPSPQAEPVTPRRVVENRNPFGNTQVASNLMADGDFELTGRFDQQPWLAFGQQGQSVLNFETGGRCRSGVRCLVMTPGEVVVGWMATPREGKVSISLWAKPEGGACKDLVVRVLDVDTNDDAAAITAPEPNERGECLFEGSVPAIPGGAPAVWLEVEERAKSKRIVVDDVVAQPAAPGVSARSLNLASKTKAPLRQPFVSDWLRKHRRFGLPPKTGPEMPLPSPQQRLRER